MSQKQEEYILRQSAALDDAVGAQLVVVTVPTLGEQSIEEYANELFNEWGIGGKEKDNGLLVLLSVGEREVRIEVGYGLEGAVNDAKAGRLLDTYAIPSFQEDAFGEGLVRLYNAMLPLVYEEYGMEVPSQSGAAYDESIREDYEYRDEEEGISSAAVVVILIIVLIVLINSRSGPRRPSGPFGRSRGGYVVLRRSIGRMNYPGSFGGPGGRMGHPGGFGRSGGGRSGGFGGHSGGGGRSGGGGASRKF